jgi:hypothetical protein
MFAARLEQGDANMPTKPRKTKSQMGSDGERKLASGHGRGAKSGGEAKKPATGKPKREPVRGPTQSGTPKRAKDDTSRSRRRGSSKDE